MLAFVLMTSALRSAVIDIVKLFLVATGTGSQSGQVEHALGDEFAIANFGEGQKPACHRDIDCAATIGRIPSAQQNGLAPVEPCRISPCDGQCRDVVQRGLNGQKRVGEAALARRGSIAQSLQLFQRNHVRLAEWADQGPPQRADMAVTAENPADIAGQRPHIGSLAALGLEHGMAVIRLFYKG